LTTSHSGKILLVPDLKWFLFWGTNRGLAGYLPVLPAIWPGRQYTKLFSILASLCDNRLETLPRRACRSISRSRWVILGRSLHRAL